MPRTTPVVANDNFWAKVDKTETCWLWTGHRTPAGGRYGQGGYGLFSSALAHRVAYESSRGPIPEGMTIDHLCGVTACVNPSHLEPTTQAENTRRYYATVTHCKWGHELAGDNVRLNEKQGRTERICKACDRRRHQKRKRAVEL